MLTDELVGRSFNKAARNRDLQAVIDRSKGSIEFKHQNISAVLLGLGQPWIEGHKPAANFQNALVDGVLRWLEARTEWLAPDRLSRAALNVPEAQGSLRIRPPPTVRNGPSPIDPAFMATIGRQYDVAERDARNRARGKAGEECVLHQVGRRLSASGRADLADNSRWPFSLVGNGFCFHFRGIQAEGIG